MVFSKQASRLAFEPRTPREEILAVGKALGLPRTSILNPCEGDRVAGFPGHPLTRAPHAMGSPIPTSRGREGSGKEEGGIWFLGLDLVPSRRPAGRVSVYLVRWIDAKT